MDAETGRSSSWRPHVPALVIAGGLLWLAVMLSHATPGRFPTGDAGMKYLMVEQMATGRLGITFHLDVPGWLADAWRDTGTFPFAPPFVYGVNGELRFAQPVGFLFLTAPFFAAFGWAGLLMLPMLAVILLWLRFLRTCRVLGFDVVATATTLGTIIFALAITPYGAMFWEHAPAVALAFAGIAELVESQVETRPAWRLVLGGVLLGLAGWLRPEAIVLSALVCGLWLIPHLRARTMRNWLLFTCAAVATIAVFLAINLAVYGSLLGLHARQENVVVEGVPVFERVKTFGLSMYLELARTAPAAGIITMVGAVLAWWRRADRNPWIVPLLCLLPATLLAVPWIAPNDGGLQWSARYMLVGVPPAALAAGWITGKLRPRSAPVMLWAVALTAAGLVSVFGGTRTIRYLYHDRTELLHAITDANPGIAVVATDQYIPQELATRVRDQPMFVLHEQPPTPETLLGIARGLETAGHSQFALIVGFYRGVPPDVLNAFSVSGDERRVVFEAVPVQSAMYRVYRATILKPETPAT